MLRVPIHRARAGMRLASPVLHPQRGNVLLNVGFELSDPLIRKMDELHVHECWIEYPGTDAIAKFVSPALMQRRGRLIQHLSEILDHVQRGTPARLDFTPYQHTIRELIEEVASDPTAGAFVLELGGTMSNELRHAAEVSFLSIVLGLKLRDYLLDQRRRLSPNDARNVIGLGLGALLHDVGMIKLDADVRDRFLKTHDDQDPEWRAHVMLGYRLLSGSIRPSAAGVIAQHHQHYDGSGFPEEKADDGSRRPLVGEEIHVFARIVCLTNHFDRMRRQPDGTLLPRVRVMRDLLFTELAGRFDPIVLAALSRAVPVYTPGTLVALSTGESAIVTGWHQHAPCRPPVSVIQLDGDELPAEPREPVRTVDLTEERDTFIVEEGGADVSDANYHLPEDVLLRGSAA